MTGTTMGTKIKRLAVKIKILATKIMRELSIEEHDSSMDANRLFERKKLENIRKTQAQADDKSSNSPDRISPRERL